MCGITGPVLAALLLVLRLLAPGAMPSVPAVLAAFPICHGADAGTPAPDAPAKPDGDCALCPMCHLAAGPALLPAPPGTPLPHLAALGEADAPAPHRERTDQRPVAVRARGPPVLA